jgi:hypothetical protein
MAPGPWRTTERDNLVETTIKLVNGILAIASIWLVLAFAHWSVLLVLDLLK